jgi:hypothetical protein
MYLQNNIRLLKADLFENYVVKKPGNLSDPKKIILTMCRIEKNPIMISPYPIFEVNKLPHDDIF